MITALPILPFVALQNILYFYTSSNPQTRTRRVSMEENQADMVGKAFVQHYYHLFDTDRASLTGLYHPHSILTFEGQRFVGPQDISAKIINLPFGSCQHTITTIDCQPSSFNGGILVFVSGSLQLHGEDHQLRFSQMFLLVPTGQGSFCVQNDIFRLNYG